MRTSIRARPCAGTRMDAIDRPARVNATVDGAVSWCSKMTSRPASAGASAAESAYVTALRPRLTIVSRWRLAEPSSPSESLPGTIRVVARIASSMSISPAPWRATDSTLPFGPGAGSALFWRMPRTSWARVRGCACR